MKIRFNIYQPRICRVQNRTKNTKWLNSRKIFCRENHIAAATKINNSLTDRPTGGYKPLPTKAKNPNIWRGPEKWQKWILRTKLLKNGASKWNIFLSMRTKAEQLVQWCSNVWFNLIWGTHFKHLTGSLYHLHSKGFVQKPPRYKPYQILMGFDSGYHTVNEIARNISYSEKKLTFHLLHHKNWKNQFFDNEAIYGPTEGTKGARVFNC